MHHTAPALRGLLHFPRVFPEFSFQMGMVISVNRLGLSMLAGPEELPLVFLILELQTAVHLSVRKPRLRELINSGSHQADFKLRGFHLPLIFSSRFFLC
jgi:hypothetical protein